MNNQRRYNRHTLGDADKGDFLGAVKCLMTSPAKSGIEGAKTIWDELQNCHVTQANYIHYVGCVSPFVAPVGQFFAGSLVNKLNRDLPSLITPTVHSCLGIGTTSTFSRPSFKTNADSREESRTGTSNVTSIYSSTSRTHQYGALTI